MTTSWFEIPGLALRRHPGMTNSTIRSNITNRNPPMALVLTEEQSMLRDSARGLISDKAPVSHLRQLRDSKDATGFSRDLWKTFAEMGFSGLLVPEEFRRQRARLRRGRRGDGGDRPHLDAVAVPGDRRAGGVRAVARRQRRAEVASICRRSPTARCWRRSRSTRAPNIARCRPRCRRCAPATASGSTAPRPSWSTATPPIS